MHNSTDPPAKVRKDQPGKFLINKFRADEETTALWLKHAVIGPCTDELDHRISHFIILYKSVANSLKKNIKVVDQVTRKASDSFSLQ